MDLDRSNNMTLWKDRVALELNVAILHSFSMAGVTIVDQHSSLEQYMIHMKNEMRERGGCPSDWVWLNPSQSGSLCPVYHQETLHYHLSPSFQRQVGLLITNVGSIYHVIWLQHKSIFTYILSIKNCYFLERNVEIISASTSYDTKEASSKNNRTFCEDIGRIIQSCS